MVNDIDYSKTMDLYKSKMCKHMTAVKNWEENNQNVAAWCMRTFPLSWRWSYATRMPLRGSTYQPAGLGYSSSATTCNTIILVGSQGKVQTLLLRPEGHTVNGGLL